MKRLLSVLALVLALAVSSSSDSVIPRSHASVWSDSNAVGLNSGNNAQLTVATVFSTPVIVTRVQVYVSTGGSGCSTAPVFGLRDSTSSSNLAGGSQVTIANGASPSTFDSGNIAVAVTPGDNIVPTLITSASGCGTVPAGMHFAINFR